MNEQKAKPILFNGEMVKAILDGRKTMTRRVLNPQPPENCTDPLFDASGHGWFYDGLDGDGNCLEVYPDDDMGLWCPYGRDGDLLWVRETFWKHPHDQFIYYEQSPRLGKRDGDTRLTSFYHVRSDEYMRFGLQEEGYKKTPSIFMPRWASRLTLRVTAVRVEPVQDISAYDAMREGIEQAHSPLNKATIETLGSDSSTGQAAINDFMVLWDSINTKRGYSWESNPFVWVVEFEKVN